MNEDNILPDTSAIERISAQLTAGLKPVRPLPSNGLLWSISLFIFVVLSIVVAQFKGLNALAALSGGEMGLYYGAILLFAGVFARAVIERMIPGARHFVRCSVLPLVTLAALALLMLGIFQDRTTASFVSHGVPCLEMGIFSALLSGALGWRLLKRGYWVSPRETVMIYAFYAGLVGVSVLALHCPIRNSLHFLVWHLGAMLIAGLAGLVLGNYAD